MTSKSSAGLRETIDGIRKKHGETSVQRVSEIGDGLDVEFLPTGIATVDVALGGGMPKGRMVEIFGPEASAKTTLALYTIAAAQKAGGEVCFMDIEHALDPTWARKCGVELDSVLWSQPDSGEAAWEIIHALAGSGEIAVIVVDSVTALLPLAEQAGDMTDSHMAVAARMNSTGLKKLTNMNKGDTIIIFINQMRSNIGVMYGPSDVTTGGKAFGYYTSVRIRSKQKGAKADRILSPGEIDPAGLPIEIYVAKNRCAPPLRTARFDLMYDTGVDMEGALLEAAVEAGVAGQKGAWFYDANGEKLGQGKQKASQYLQENPEVAETIRTALHKQGEVHEEAEKT